MYSERVTPPPKAKTTDQADSTDSFLSQEGAVYPAVLARHEAWCAAGLHRTTCVRMHVVLFGEPELSDDPTEVKVEMVEGGAESRVTGERNVLVTLDAPNAYLLLGPPTFVTVRVDHVFRLRARGMGR